MTGTKQSGDYQFILDLEPPYKKFLNDVNNNRVNGMLVIEIIPRDQINNPIVQIPKKVTELKPMVLGYLIIHTNGMNYIQHRYIAEVIAGNLDYCNLIIIIHTLQYPQIFMID